MIYNLILTFILVDSFLPFLAVLRGYFLGKYAIVNKLNRMYILNKYIKSNILGSKKKIPFINNGLLLCFLLCVPHSFIRYNYFRNDDANIYYLNNIEKYYNYNQNLLSWNKLGFNIGQIIYYNKYIY